MQPRLERVQDSILAADVGSVWTRLVLIDRVEGEFRFVAGGSAPTTASGPHRDVSVGVRAAARRIERVTGRELMDGAADLIVPEDEEGRGVDLFVVSTSAAPPLRVAAGGLVGRLSSASARRAVLGTYSRLQDLFSYDSPRGRWGSPRGVAGVVEALIERWPDAFLIAGGTDENQDPALLELVDAVRLALAAQNDAVPPTLIFAGSDALAEEARGRLDGYDLMMAENVRPTMESERPRGASRLLDQVYRRRALERLPGLATLQVWGRVEPIATAEAHSRVGQYLALAHQQRVLVVDAGAGSTVVSATSPDGWSQTVVRTDTGLSLGANSLLALTGEAAIAGWVPGETPSGTLIEQYLTDALHPTTIPEVVTSLHLMQGAAREAIRLALDELRPVWPLGDPPAVDLLLGCGAAIREAARPEQAMALLLDAVQPRGTTLVLRDRVGLAAAVGALAGADPGAAASLIEAQGFERLGTVVSPVGRATPGQEILRFRLTQTSGVTEGTVEFGQSYRFPSMSPTTLELIPLGGMDLGLGPGVGTKIQSEQDLVGIVVDARGRPLPLPRDLAARRRLTEEWLQYVGA